MEKLTNTKTLTIAAMLTALGIIFGFFKIPINQIIEIRFDSLPIELAGLLFGPGIAGIVGGLVDIGSFIVRPTGPFFPGFTVSSIVGGMIYGFVLYKKPISLKRIAVAQVLYTLVVGVIMNSYWLDMLYFQDGFLVTIIARLPREIIMLPIKVVMFYGLVRAFGKKRIGEMAN